VRSTLEHGFVKVVAPRRSQALVLSGKAVGYDSPLAMGGGHRRRSLRLRGYNYASPGAYFVTLCTQGRACVFGNIMGTRSSTAPTLVDDRDCLA